MGSSSRWGSTAINQGNGTFAAKVSYGAGGSSLSLAAADLTGDGVPDLAVTTSTSVRAPARVISPRPIDL
jgi:hypothetical protein